MAESDGQEKTEQASGKRLEESRERGQVARSLEVNSFVVFTSGLAIVFITKEYIAKNLMEFATFIFSSATNLSITINELQSYAIKGVLFFLSLIAPVLAGIVIVALAGGYAQVGFKITPKALQPKFSKLNPLSGIKNIVFSTRSIIEVVKALVKLALVGLFAYWVIEDAIITSVDLVNFSIQEILGFMIDTSFQFIWKIAIFYAILAASDFAYQKFKHKKDLMMTKQEVKEENKQLEGDPLIKSKIRSKQMMLARSRMMKEVPKADVVITNPTHYAVALKYDVGGKSAPRVVAKGVDLVAQRIKVIAIEHGVPLHEDVPLARALYKHCELGDQIPTSLYRAVAQILAYIYQAKNRKKKKSII